MHDPNLFSLAPKNNKHKSLRCKSIFNSFCPCFRFPVITPCFYNPVLFFSVFLFFMSSVFNAGAEGCCQSLWDWERKERERERDKRRQLSSSCARSYRQWLKAAVALQPRRIPPCTAPLSSSSTRAHIPENFQTCMHNPHSTSMLKRSINLYCLIRVSVIFFLDRGFNCLFSHPAQCLDARSIEHCAPSLSLSHARTYAHTLALPLTVLSTPSILPSLPPSFSLSCCIRVWQLLLFCS